jgi:hypothetical protein
MENEFEFEDDNVDFGETQEIEFEIENLDIQVRTAVLSKNNMFALLCLKTAEQGGAICRVDPREDRPAVQVYDDPEKATDWFQKSLRTSKRNGWKVIYDGLPLYG